MHHLQVTLELIQIQREANSGIVGPVLAVNAAPKMMVYDDTSTGIMSKKKSQVKTSKLQLDFDAASVESVSAAIGKKKLMVQVAAAATTTGSVTTKHKVKTKPTKSKFDFD